MLGKAKVTGLTEPLSFITGASKKVHSGKDVVSTEHQTAQLMNCPRFGG